jgi:hypothetical protein
MPVPTVTTPAGSLAERVRQALARQDSQPVAAPAAAPGKPPCLMLDVSGSMAEDCEPGRAKIDALRDLVAGLKADTIYAFDHRVTLTTAHAIPDPGGATIMAGAFCRARKDGHLSAVLITDGLPTDPEADVLRAAAGIHLDIFYVGPAPKPAFLDRLAAACRGRAHQANLRKQAQPQLQQRIRGLLVAPLS